MATLGSPGSPGSVSRTARYRKVTKPLLERRRRARINRCLDELKDLMVGALEVERENISKLEKADILELTVRHLSKLRGPRDPRAEVERFQAGFGHCASEAYQFILSSPGIDSNITQQLVRHLSAQMNEGQLAVPSVASLASPVPSDSSLSPGTSSRGYSPNYYSGQRSAAPSVSPVEYPARRQPAWKEDPPSVPIEQSLTCDVASFNPRPAQARNPALMTGLLMTVSNDYPSDHVNKQVDRQRIPEIKEKIDLRGPQSSESKNLIMQKIREHILERQHREPESQEQQKPNRNHYSAPSQQHRPAHIYPPSNHQQPPRDDIVHSSVPKDVGRAAVFHKEVTARAMPPVLTPSTSEEAINLCSVAAAAQRLSHESQYQRKFEEAKCDERKFKATKHQTDYKSIHPKKVMIRNPLDNPENGVVGKEGSLVQQKDSQFDDGDISVAVEYYMKYKNRESKKDQQYDDQMDDENMWRPW